LIRYAKGITLYTLIEVTNMAYKDTLTLYKELVASGVPEAQADIQSHQMGSLADSLIGRFEIMDARFVKMDAKLDLSIQGIRKDLMWMRIIGGAMTLTFLANFFK
jgi:hypothetical protein